MKQISKMNIIDIYFELMFIKEYHKDDYDISDIYKRAKELYQNENKDLELTDDEVKMWIHNKCCYEVLTGLLYNMIRKLNENETYEDKFMFYNFPIIMDLKQQFLENCEIDNNYNIKDLTNLTDEEIDKYICDILRKIDPSLEWLNMYLKAKKEGKIIYLNKYNEKQLNKLKDNLKLDKIPTGNSCVVLDDDTCYLALTYNNTIQDIIDTIHELIHFIIKNKNIKLPNILSEFFSIFYELYTLSYLHKKGFDINELFTIYQKIRIVDLSLISLSFNSLYNYLDILVKNRKVQLDDDLKYYEIILEKKDILPPKFKYVKPIDLAYKRCDEYIKFLLDNEFYNMYPYIIGSYLALEISRKSNNEILDKIKNFISIENTIVDPYDIFKMAFSDLEFERVGEDEVQKEKRP